MKKPVEITPRMIMIAKMIAPLLITRVSSKVVVQALYEMQLRQIANAPVKEGVVDLSAVPQGSERDTLVIQMMNN